MEAHERHYTLVIQWSDEDQAYIVKVPELPGCITHGATYHEAVDQAMEAIDAWAVDVAERDLPSPQTFDPETVSDHVVLSFSQ